MAFRDMLFLQKFKVALNPNYRTCLKFSKMFLFLNGKKYVKNKNFYRVVFKLLAPKVQKQGVFELFSGCHGNIFRRHLGGILIINESSAG